MSMVGIGVMEMVIMLGFGGGMGLPVGIPPAPEDPTMARVAPEECIFYTTWSAMAEPDANSENQTEQLLAEPEVQHLIGTIEKTVLAVIEKETARQGPQAAAAARDAARWVKTVLTHSAAIYVGSVSMGAAGPVVDAGALVNVGDDADQLQEDLAKYLQMLPPGLAQPVEIDGETWNRVQVAPMAPAVTWGVKGRYFIVGVGEGTVEKILERGATAEPEWLAEVRRQLPVERRSTLTYLDVKGATEPFFPLLGERGAFAARGIVEALREIEIELGISPRDDLLKPLGDVWRIYNSPGEGGFVITGLTLVVDVDDPGRLAATQQKLVARVSQEFGERGPRIEQFEYAGREIYFFNARDDDFPLAPAWCLADDKLIVSTFPSPPATARWCFPISTCRNCSRWSTRRSRFSPKLQPPSCRKRAST